MRLNLCLSTILIVTLNFNTSYAANPGAVTSLAFCLDATQTCKLKNGCAPMNKRLRACENMRNRKAQAVIAAQSQKSKNKLDKLKYTEPVEYIEPIFAPVVDRTIDKDGNVEAIEAKPAAPASVVTPEVPPSVVAPIAAPAAQ